MYAALAASAVLAVAGLATFWVASQKARHSQAADGAGAIKVVIDDKACQPNAITVPAGRTTFAIVNQSNRALEWEILDGVMVVEERENIAPGFTQKMTVKLDPGQFAITCGLLSNPHGTLTVTPSSASKAEAAQPPLVKFIGPLAEYQVYLALQTDDLHTAVQQLAAAMNDGDLQKARALYAAAHQNYKRIEPVAALYADLDARIDARAQYFEKREADPGFGGFHRIEYMLFSKNSTQGAGPTATQLLADIATLEQRLTNQTLKPAQLAASASRLLRRVAGNISADTNTGYDAIQPADLQGTFEGTRKIAGLLAPLVTKAAPALQHELDTNLAQFGTQLAAYEKGADFERVELDQAQRDALSAPVRSLAGNFDQINPALGLN
jgi:iron uptake system component EfeO